MTREADGTRGVVDDAGGGEREAESRHRDPVVVWRCWRKQIKRRLANL